MSEHLAGMNDKLTSQKDQIDSLTIQLKEAQKGKKKKWKQLGKIHELFYAQNIYSVSSVFTAESKALTLVIIPWSNTIQLWRNSKWKCALQKTTSAHPLDALTTENVARSKLLRIKPGEI